MEVEAHAEAALDDVRDELPGVESGRIPGVDGAGALDAGPLEDECQLHASHGEVYAHLNGLRLVRDDLHFVSRPARRLASLEDLRRRLRNLVGYGDVQLAYCQTICALYDQVTHRLPNPQITIDVVLLHVRDDLLPSLLLVRQDLQEE